MSLPKCELCDRPFLEPDEKVASTDVAASIFEIQSIVKANSRDIKNVQLALQFLADWIQRLVVK
jgi:hypothetical protein